MKDAMRAVVAPFLKHEPIRPLWAYYPQPRYPELRTWQQDAWAHNEMLRAMFEEPVSVVHPPFENGIARGPIDVDVDLEEFEQAILRMQAEYEKAMGVKPTVIDLPNWTRGTILEQIAFNNGFTIADRRPDEQPS